MIVWLGDQTVEGQTITKIVVQIESDAITFPDGRIVLPAGAAATVISAVIDGQPVYVKAAADAPVTGRLRFADHRFELNGTFVGDPSLGDHDELSLHLVGDIKNIPPTVWAGVDQSVECAEPGGATVNLQGTATDPDGDDTLFSTWFEVTATEKRIVGSGLSPSVFLPLGEHSLELMVMDNHFVTRRDRVKVSVLDTSAPVIESLSIEPECLWPPNHRLTKYRLGQEVRVSASDACDTAPVVQVSAVTSSQPDNGLGDGDTAPDVVVGPNSFCVRAERSGTVRQGRAYTVEVSAVDASGNASSRSAQLRVPHASSRSCARPPATPLEGCP